jgi:hypothetical protein
MRIPISNIKRTTSSALVPYEAPPVAMRTDAAHLTSLAKECVRQLKSDRGVALVPLFTKGSLQEAAVRRDYMDVISSNESTNPYVVQKSATHQFMTELAKEVYFQLTGERKHDLSYTDTTVGSPALNREHIDPSTISLVLACDGDATKYLRKDDAQNLIYQAKHDKDTPFRGEHHIYKEDVLRHCIKKIPQFWSHVPYGSLSIMVGRCGDRYTIDKDLTQYPTNPNYNKNIPEDVHPILHNIPDSVAAKKEIEKARFRTSLIQPKPDLCLDRKVAIMEMIN